MDDYISRQAAIDAMEQAKEQYFDRKVIIGKMQNVVSNLPSAQPVPQWIPCSERLPEHSKRYLVSVLDGIDRRTTVAPYLPRSRTWSLTGRMAYWKVIAWMPLPEPYREDIE